MGHTSRIGAAMDGCASTGNGAAAMRVERRMQHKHGGGRGVRSAVATAGVVAGLLATSTAPAYAEVKIEAKEPSAMVVVSSPNRPPNTCTRQMWVTVRADFPEEKAKLAEVIVNVQNDITQSGTGLFASHRDPAGMSSWETTVGPFAADWGSNTVTANWAAHNGNGLSRRTVRAFTSVFVDNIPPGKFIDDELKCEMGQGSSVLNAGALAWGGAAIRFPALAVPLGAVAAIWAGTAWAITQVALDPIDERYTEIAQPVAPTLSRLEPSGEVPPKVAAALNAVADNEAELLAHARALVTAINRAQGALAAGASTWQAAQLRNAGRMGQEIDRLLVAGNGLRGAAAEELSSTTLGTTPLSAADFEALKGQVWDRQLPEALQSGLREISATPQEREQLIGAILAARPTAGTTLVDLLRDPASAAKLASLASRLGAWGVERERDPLGGSPHPTTLRYSGPTSGQYSDSVQLKATLTDASVSPAVPVPGKNVHFTLGDETVTAGPTDVTGTASVETRAVDAPGSVPAVRASFPGDTGYLASSTEVPFVLAKEDCTLRYTGPVAGSPTSPVLMSAVFGEPDTLIGDLGGKEVVFTLRRGTATTTARAATDAQGTASVAQTLSAGRYEVVSSFAGDALHGPCSGDPVVVTASEPGSAPTGNLVVHPSFEPPGFPTVSSFTSLGLPRTPSVGAWTFERGGFDIVGPGAARAADGTQFVDLNGNGFGPASIYQDVKTDPGRQYRVSIQLAGNPNGAPIEKRVVVGFGTSEQEFTFETTGHTNANLGWAEKALEATGACNASVTRLTLRSTTQSAEHRGPNVDLVKVVDVTPPSGPAACTQPVNGAPVVDAGADVTATEGSPVQVTGAVSDPDGDAVATTWRVTPGVGVDAGAACTIADPASLATGVVCTDEGAYELTLTGVDGKNPPVSDTTTLVVGNVAPTAALTTPANGTVAFRGDSVFVATSFTDAGVNDTHTCSLAWGDGTVSQGKVDEAARTCVGDHAYSAGGSRELVVTVIDDDGGVGAARVRLVIARRGGAFGVEATGVVAVARTPLSECTPAGSSTESAGGLIGPLLAEQVKTSCTIDPATGKTVARASLGSATVFGTVRLEGISSECVADEAGARGTSGVAKVNGVAADGRQVMRLPGFTVYVNQTTTSPDGRMAHSAIRILKDATPLLGLPQEVVLAGCYFE